MSRPPLPPSHVAAVALGGALGAVLRWLISDAVPHDTGFPWATFAINLSGAFFLALLPAFAVIREHPVLPPLLGTGFLGGYTTLSTFSEETRVLLDSGATWTAAAYVFGTLAAALTAVRLANLFDTTAERDTFEAEEGDR